MKKLLPLLLLITIGGCQTQFQDNTSYEYVGCVNTFGEASVKSLVIVFITCLLLFLLLIFSVNHDLKNKNFNTKFESVKKVLEANKNKRISECYDNAPRHTWDDIDCSGKEQ